MRLWKAFPALAIALTLGLGACAEQGADEGEELTPADTALTTPPPAEEPAMGMDDTMMGDTMMMEDTAHQM